MTNTSELQFADLWNVGPETPAGRYLRLFWHPVYRGKDLQPRQAKPVELLSQKFTLYRGEDGTARLVNFRCPHRGVQLSLGWVEGDSIRCRYHGWKFDGCGQCIEQPLDQRGIAKTVRLASYPVHEYLGLIFVFIGAGSPPRFPQYPDFDRPGALVTEPVEVLPCNFWNRLENDIAHFAWAHRATSVRRGLTELLQPRLERVKESPFGYISLSPLESEETSFRNTAHFFMPNVYQLWIRTRAKGFEGRDLGDTKITWTVPVNDTTLAAYDVTYTPLSGEEARAYETSRLEQMEDEAATRWDLAERILAGEMTLEDLPTDLGAYTTFAIEDYVTQVGQGTYAERGSERLVNTDSRVAILRRIWLREVSALIAGKALTDWKQPTEPLHDRAGSDSPPERPATGPGALTSLREKV